jgi:hypothetical protein
LVLLGTCFASEIAPVENPQFWSNDGAFVVYGQVLDVRKESADRTGELLIRPIATLSGDFDSAKSGDIPVTVLMGRGVAFYSILGAPTNGSKIIAVITRVPANVSNTNTAYLHIPNSFVNCFPIDPKWKAIGIDGRPPLFEVTGFDDPKVTETIENLRKLRGKQREEAEKAKAEQKAAAEKNGK